jgi:predicted ATPase
VGRQQELDTLRQAAERVQAGRGQIVAVMADAGVGKSRLYHEFKATSQSGWTVLEAFSVSYGRASAYLPVLELLSTYFEIGRDDDERKRRERILGKVLGLDRRLEDTLPYLYWLHGIADTGDSLAEMDPRIRRRRTQEAIKRIVLRESLNRPLMIIFEDLHWIDSETQGCSICWSKGWLVHGSSYSSTTGQNTGMNGPAGPITLSSEWTHWATRVPKRCFRRCWATTRS